MSFAQHAERPAGSASDWSISNSNPCLLRPSFSSARSGVVFGYVCHVFRKPHGPAEWHNENSCQKTHNFRRIQPLVMQQQVRKAFKLKHRKIILSIGMRVSAWKPRRNFQGWHGYYLWSWSCPSRRSEGNLYFFALSFHVYLHVGFSPKLVGETV